MPPPMLQIVREPLEPGVEAAYEAIERETASLAARLGCPNPYLAIEALTGPKEVWYFNGYASPADRQRVWDAYAANTTLMAALTASGSRKRPLTLPAIDVCAQYREEVSHDPAWSPGVGRFLVIAVTNTHSPRESRLKGTVFEADEGTQFTIVATQTRAEADRIAAAAASVANVFRVRPDWSVPERQWVASDPAFWEQNRTA